MPNPQLDQLMHALVWKAVPVVVSAGIAALLLRETLNWIERRGGRFVRRMGEARATGRTLSAATVASRNGVKTPQCPSCKRMMVKRTARRGAQAGSRFWGCSNYPTCRATRGI